MQPLNYCRQMVKQFAHLLDIPNIEAASREILSHAVDLAQASQKFLLPDGGRLFDDKEFRALDDTEPLRLPFEMIALEYPQSGIADAAEVHPLRNRSSKRIVFVRERDGILVLTPVIWMDEMGRWGPLPEAAIPTTGYLSGRVLNAGGRVTIKIACQDKSIPPEDYADEAGAVLCFLNALECSNVRSERVEPVKQPKKSKGVLQFDSHHILTIGGISSSGTSAARGDGHRSPREHLRRGHIRRYEKGLKIWVNAHVVGAGSLGRISKDYRLSGR